MKTITGKLINYALKYKVSYCLGIFADTDKKDTEFSDFTEGIPNIKYNIRKKKIFFENGSTIHLMTIGPYDTYRLEGLKPDCIVLSPNLHKKVVDAIDIIRVTARKVVGLGG